MLPKLSRSLPKTRTGVVVAVVGAVGIATVLTGAGVAVAAGRYQAVRADGSIHACFNNASFVTRTVPAGHACNAHETSFSYNQTGPTGQAGVPGATGAKGATGAQGTVGPQGGAGVGTAGAPGAAGPRGLKGERGAAGANGNDGLAGANGNDGAPGVNGTDGAPGVNGNDGAPGVNGTDGAPGVNGTDGKDGAAGANGITTGIISRLNSASVPGGYAMTTLIQFHLPSTSGYAINAKLTVQRQSSVTVPAYVDCYLDANGEAGDSVETYLLDSAAAPMALQIMIPYAPNSGRDALLRCTSSQPINAWKSVVSALTLTSMTTVPATPAS